jgi:hypothetical protein
VVGVPFILDLAFERLSEAPLLDGGCFPGDILSALIRADASVWDERPSLRGKLAELYREALDAPIEINDAFRESLSLPHGSAGH